MAKHVKILLRRGLRNELSGDTLLPGELGYTTDTNQLYVGIEEAINELRFDPFTNAHAVIQSWLDSTDCPVSNLTVDEDLVVADIPAGQIDNIISALNNYSQEIVFNSDVATFTVGELLTQYRHKKTTITSPNVIPTPTAITSTFTIEGETITVTDEPLVPLTEITAGAFVIGKAYTIKTLGTTDFTLIGASATTIGIVFTATGVGTGTGTATANTSLLNTLQANATLKAANVISEVVGSGAASKLFFCKIDGKELNLVFATSAAGTASAEAIGFTQNIFSVTGGSFVTGTEYTITSLGTDTLTTVNATAIVSGVEYTILVPGTTDFTTIGAADSLAGTVFTATGSGSGTGTATKVASTVQQNWESAGAPAPLTAGSFVIGTQYKIVTVGTTDFTKFGSANNNVGTTFTATSDGEEQWTAGNFTIGRVYTISDIGTTDFTAIGAGSNTIGHSFTATGTGSGTGDAYFTGTGIVTSVIVGSTFTATGVGQGDGTATWDNGVNTVAEVTGYDVYANGKITASTPGSGITTVTVEVNEYSNYFAYRQEGTGYPYANAPDSTDFYKFGTPSTPDYSAMTPAVDSTSMTGATDTRIGLFGSKRKNVEVLTEESRNQLFTNQHLKSYSASTGLRSDLYKKELASTSGTFLSYDANEATSFFIDYSLKQVGSTITFVRTGTIRMINGVPQEIDLAKLTDTNVEVHQDIANIGVVDANEMSNIVFTAVIDGTAPNENIKVNYTQDANFTTEISYTVKRWTM